MEHLSEHATTVTTRNTCHDTDLQAEIGGRNLPSPQQRRYRIDHDVLFPLQGSMLECIHKSKFRKIFPGCKAKPQDKYELNIPNRLTNLLTHRSVTRAEISSLQTKLSTLKSLQYFLHPNETTGLWFLLSHEHVEPVPKEQTTNMYTDSGVKLQDTWTEVTAEIEVLSPPNSGFLE
jgi:hypothetical protein